MKIPAKTLAYRLVLILGISLAGISDSTAKDLDWGGWDNPRAKTSESSSFVRRFYHFYQTYVSSDDGANCPAYPTCSAYAYEAVTRHSVVYGSLLTLDRLLSEYPGVAKSGLYPLITKYGVHRMYDPVP